MDFRNFQINDLKVYRSNFDLDWFQKHLKRNPETIIEFGSYDGGDGLFYKNNYPECNIYSIEACPKRFQIVKKLEHEYKINVFNYAVCDIDGHINFYQVHDENVLDSEEKYGSSGLDGGYRFS